MVKAPLRDSGIYLLGWTEIVLQERFGRSRHNKRRYVRGDVVTTVHWVIMARPKNPHRRLPMRPLADIWPAKVVVQLLAEDHLAPYLHRRRLMKGFGLPRLAIANVEELAQLRLDLSAWLFARGGELPRYADPQNPRNLESPLVMASGQKHGDRRE